VTVTRVDGPATVAMFVLNDMRLDSRVRREAAALAAAGCRVTVHAVASDATRDRLDEPVDGYVIRRHPMLMRPQALAPAAGVDGPGASARVRPGPALRAAAARAFVATRPALGGSAHLLLNWHLRWGPWGRRVLRTLGPADVWHAHDLNTLPVALAAARRHGGRVVYDSHEIFVEAGATARLPRVVRAALRGRERAWAARADAIVTVNDSVAATLREALGRLDVSVVRNCAEPPVGPSPLRAAIGVTLADPVLIYHGSMTVGRGLELLVAAMADARLARAHLVLMGYGPLRPTLQGLAAVSPASGRIHFLSPVEPDAVTRWVAGGDLAVMPIEPTTLNHRLSTPNKLFEAIAAGVPVVGPDFVEFRRTVVDGPWGAVGTLHLDHTPAAIAAAAAGLLAMPEPQRAAMRARCRAAARHELRWSLEADRLLTVYDRLEVPRSPVALPAGGRVPPARPVALD
jgi:glycosyltransferase involved in cell wall biosynthesis